MGASRVTWVSRVFSSAESMRMVLVGKGDDAPFARTLEEGDGRGHGVGAPLTIVQRRVTARDGRGEVVDHAVFVRVGAGARREPFANAVFVVYQDAVGRWTQVGA